MSKQPGLFDSLPERPTSASNRRTAPLAVRESTRARRLTLRLLPQVLELVVPRGTKPAQVAAFVREHRAWIERALHELPQAAEQQASSVPQRIELRALGRAWQVAYRERAATRRPSLRTYHDRIEIAVAHTHAAGGANSSGEVAGPDTAAVAGLLRGWLREQGMRHLTPWLLRESERLELAPKAVHIRLQRTRWGSCSSNATISLNAALLFLEPAIVRYLLVHELCHLRSLDHSPRFWQAVARFEPRYRELDRALSAARAQVPAWVYPPSAGAGVVLEAML